MVGEILLNISKMNDRRFKIMTDKFTYIYITLDSCNNPINIKSLPDMIYPGEINEVRDNGNEFIIITEIHKFDSDNSFKADETAIGQLADLYSKERESSDIIALSKKISAVLSI